MVTIPKLVILNKKGQEENIKMSFYTDVSLWDRYPFSPPFSVSNFTGLDLDLLKLSTTLLALVDLCQHLRSGSDLSIPFSFLFFFSSGFKKKSKGSSFCSLQSKSGGRVLPKEQCIFLDTLYRIPILCIRIDVETVLINIFNLHFNCLPGCEMTCLGKGAFSLVAGVCTGPVRLKHPGHWSFCSLSHS